MNEALETARARAPGAVSRVALFFLGTGLVAFPLWTAFLMWLSWRGVVLAAGF